jgi:hypothetical protein
MESAIAEEPGATVRDGFVVAGDGERAPSIFQRVGLAALVKQDFGETTVLPRLVRAAPVLLLQQAHAIVERATIHSAGESRTIDR